MSRRWLAAAIGFLLLQSRYVLAAAEQVETGPEPEGGFHWDIAASYRFSAARFDRFDLDRDSTPSPLGWYGDHRLRGSALFRVGPVDLVLEGDLFNGQIAGDLENIAAGWRRIDRRDEDHGADITRAVLRKAYLEWRSPAGLLRFGQMTSRYGLGLVANAGEDDDRLFGSRRYGDIVDRIMFATTPLAGLATAGPFGRYFTLALAGDVVYRDENADLREGDLAFQGTLLASYRHPDFTNGMAVSYRWQEDDDGDRLWAVALNLHGDNRFGIGCCRSGVRLQLEYEAAMLVGSTTRFRQTGSDDGLALLGFGGVVRVSAELPSVHLEPVFEFGFASGDGNPYDGTSHAFSFDPDYNVGIVFFEEMLPLITARGVEIAADPSRVGLPPKGVDLAASQGRVSNAFYFFPQLRFRPLPELTAALGWLAIFSPARLAHPYYTYESGGTPVNHLGGVVRSRSIGSELLASVTALVPFGTGPARLLLRLENGLFLPGAALRDLSGTLPGRVWKVAGTAGLEWR